MTQETRQIEEDLSYVRGAVERMEGGSDQGIPIFVLWAMIVSIGCAINDFRPQFGMYYWPIATVVGYLASLLIGRRLDREAGEVNTAETRTHAIHWGTIFLLVIGALIIGANHGLDGMAFSQMFTLVAGGGCFLGGLHLDRTFLLPGLAMMIGAPAIDYIGPYPWTIVGLTTGIALVAGALKMRSPNG